VRRLVAFLSLAACALGCSAPAGSTYTPSSLPETTTFPYVAEFMVHRCGTLDCHGSVYRNLRVYGDEGLRYSTSDSASDIPCVPAGTTDAEVGQDYLSIVGLEPETMNAVVSDHGADPQRLTLIAKPLGIEEHKGGTLFHVGDDEYTCMTSWLAGKTNTAACLNAMPAMICGEAASSTFDGGAGSSP
jgi:hypothetical protein